MSARIRLRRDTAANLASVVLANGEPAWATDTETLKVGDGVTAFASLDGVGGGGSTGLVQVYKAADTTRTGTATLADDPDLVLPVEANAQYYGSLFLRTAAGTNCDFLFNMTGPSGSSVEFTTLATVNANPNEPGEADIAIASAGAAVIRHAHYRIYIETGGTAGNVVVQWAQQTNNGENAILKKGSLISVQKYQ